MLDFSETSIRNEGLEIERLAELAAYSIAGTEPEERFDAIARATGKLFKAPIAFLTLIEEERQWFKAAVGLDVMQSPRSGSFCTHTIMADQVMVVPDTFTDARFKHNPSVIGKRNIRFYAGAPLMTEGGYRLGALCILDTVPRHDFTHEKMGALQDLATLAMSQIDARRKEQSASAMAVLAESLGQPLLAISPTGAIEIANRHAAEFFDYDMLRMRGMEMDELIEPGHLRMGAEALITVFETSRQGEISGPFKRMVRRSDGMMMPVEMRISRWKSNDDDTGIAVLISDMPAEDTRISRLTYADEKGASLQHLVKALGEMAAATSQIGLFMLSFNGFADKSTAGGPKIGNAVLQKLCRRLRRDFPDAAIIARPVNSDLAIVARGICDSMDGYAFAEILCAIFDEGTDPEVAAFQLSPSIGFAIATADASSARQLIDHAEFALATVHRSTVPGVLMYDANLKTGSAAQHLMQLELAAALKNKELRLYYQPQVSLADGQITGVEALIRWQHPQRGLLMPKDFLADVENGNLAGSIGWWALETACAQLSIWQRAGRSGLKMAVNLFPAQFLSEQLVPVVIDLLSRYALDPGSLELEITERITLSQDSRGIACLCELRALGVQIAFDDFGTGYASLSSLQQFPLTALKLDRSFVCNILTNANDAIITRSMISMANELDLDTVAEGIETAEQQAFLQLLGCKVGQGYFFSIPLPADELEPMLFADLSGLAAGSMPSAASKVSR